MNDQELLSLAQKVFESSGQVYSDAAKLNQEIRTRETEHRTAGDWTMDRGASNSSQDYTRLVAHIERLLSSIRPGEPLLHTARVIVSHLAHVHGLVLSRPIDP